MRVNNITLLRLSSKVCPLPYWYPPTRTLLTKTVVVQTMISQVILGVRYVLQLFVFHELHRLKHRIGHSMLRGEIGVSELPSC
jgi:hypothetical protein